MPISTAGKTDAGFTLIEVVVVVLLIVLSLGIVTGINFKQRDSLALKATGRHLYSFLQSARSQSILHQQVNQCWYFPEENRVMSDLKQRSLDRGPGIALTDPGQTTQPLKQEKKLLVYFYPDGSASADDICIQSGDLSMSLSIDPLLGFISLQSGCSGQPTGPAT